MIKRFSMYVLGIQNLLVIIINSQSLININAIKKLEIPFYNRTVSIKESKFSLIMHYTDLGVYGAVTGTV